MQVFKSSFLWLAPLTPINIAEPESEIGGITSFTVAAAEALINLYRGRDAITQNTCIGHSDHPPHTSICCAVLVEEIDDIDRMLSTSCDPFNSNMFNQGMSH